MPIKPQVEGIREAGRSDIPALLKYMARRADVNEAWLKERVEQVWDDWIVFVALDGTEIVGFVAAARDRDLMGNPSFIVRHINVIRPGIAKRLMNEVTRLGSTVWEIAPATEAQVRLAKSFGFHQIGVVMAT